MLYYAKHKTIGFMPDCSLPDDDVNAIAYFRLFSESIVEIYRVDGYELKLIWSENNA